MSPAALAEALPDLFDDDDDEIDLGTADLDSFSFLTALSDLASDCPSSPPPPRGLTPAEATAIVARLRKLVKEEAAAMAANTPESQAKVIRTALHAAAAEHDPQWAATLMELIDQLAADSAKLHTVIVPDHEKTAPKSTKTVSAAAAGSFDALFKHCLRPGYSPREGRHGEVFTGSTAVGASVIAVEVVQRPVQPPPIGAHYFPPAVATAAAALTLAFRPGSQLATVGGILNTTKELPKSRELKGKPEAPITDLMIDFAACFERGQLEAHTRALWTFFVQVVSLVWQLHAAKNRLPVSFYTRKTLPGDTYDVPVVMALIDKTPFVLFGNLPLMQGCTDRPLERILPAYLKHTGWIGAARAHPKTIVDAVAATTAGLPKLSSQSFVTAAGQLLGALDELRHKMFAAPLAGAGCGVPSDRIAAAKTADSVYALIIEATAAQEWHDVLFVLHQVPDALYALQHWLERLILELHVNHGMNRARAALETLDVALEAFKVKCDAAKAPPQRAPAAAMGFLEQLALMSGAAPDTGSGLLNAVLDETLRGLTDADTGLFPLPPQIRDQDPTMWLFWILFRHVQNKYQIRVKAATIVDLADPKVASSIVGGVLPPGDRRRAIAALVDDAAAEGGATPAQKEQVRTLCDVLVDDSQGIKPSLVKFCTTMVADFRTQGDNVLTSEREQVEKDKAEAAEIVRVTRGSVKRKANEAKGPAANTRRQKTA